MFLPDFFFDCELAVLGDGLLMNGRPGGPFEIYVLGDGCVRRLGSFADAREAWEALDLLDLEGVGSTPTSLG